MYNIAKAGSIELKRPNLALDEKKNRRRQEAIGYDHEHRITIEHRYNKFYTIPLPLLVLKFPAFPGRFLFPASTRHAGGAKLLTAYR